MREYGHFCDDSTIASGQLLSDGNNMACFEGCKGSPGSLAFRCTDYSEADDWTSGRNSVIYDPGVSGTIKFG